MQSAWRSVVNAFEVNMAVQTLYAERVRPYGRLVRKRLVERAMSKGCVDVNINIADLKEQCRKYRSLEIIETDNDWCSLLREPGRHALSSWMLVDVYSPLDPYPQSMWEAFQAYLEGLGEEMMRMPGGRYACAKELLARNLYFLRGRTLGEVCHMVQLAISQRHILGYLNGCIVPFRMSQSLLKEGCAKQKRPVQSVSAEGHAIATWDDVKESLGEIVQTTLRNGASMPLANVKRMFRSRYHLVLSETSLGYPKLSALLRDPEMSAICSLRLEGNVYKVFAPDVPLVPPTCAKEEGAVSSRRRKAKGRAGKANRAGRGKTSVATPTYEMPSHKQEQMYVTSTPLPTLLGAGRMQMQQKIKELPKQFELPVVEVRNTFIEFRPPTPTFRRTRSVPELMGVGTE